MQKYVKFPFIFLLIAASIGLMLRWNFLVELSWLKFPYWLHAHSHLMFLGWVFNFILLVFVQEYAADSSLNKFRKIFLVIQVLLIGMMISFPLQGYGIFSIVVSTLHTLAVAIVVFIFFKQDTVKEFDGPRWFAKISLVFFLISFAGPLSLGPIMANGLGQTKWYYFAIYYYLHFQYNGVFTFGVFSIFFKMLKAEGATPDEKSVRRFGLMFLLAAFPTYFLSILWAKPGLIFNAFGLVGAIMQLWGVVYFVLILSKIPVEIWKCLPVATRYLLVVSLLAFITKVILQFISAHPDIANLAYEFRNYVMAYLHLVLLGMITSFLLAWSFYKGWLHRHTTNLVFVYLVGFIGTEFLLVAAYFHINGLINTTSLLFLFSTLLVISISGFVFNLRRD